MKIFVILCKDSTGETHTVRAYLDKEFAEEQLDYLEKLIYELCESGCKTFKTNTVLLEEIRLTDENFEFDLFKTPDYYSLHEVELNCYDR